MTKQDELVTCCFCGRSVPISRAVLLVAYPRQGADESQNLYAHGACLRSRLHPTVPIHPDIVEDEFPDTR